MPKSRRDKVVALTQTKKKDREWKGGLIDSIRAALDEYSGVFVFRCANLRNNVFKDMKADLRDSSRFFMGSNKVMQVALGKGPEDEQRDGLHKLASHVRGHAGVCFSNLSAADLASALERYATADFARTGSVASETVVVERGPVRGPHGGLMEHTMEPTLRKNGMPTKLNRGVIELLADHVVCKEGEHVSPQAAILLRLFGKALATFEIALVCGWMDDGTFETYAAAEEAELVEDDEPFDPERDRFKNDHVPESMMLPPELANAPAGVPVEDLGAGTAKPKRRSARNKK